MIFVNGLLTVLETIYETGSRRIAFGDFCYCLAVLDKGLSGESDGIYTRDLE